VFEKSIIIWKEGIILISKLSIPFIFYISVNHLIYQLYAHS